MEPHELRATFPLVRIHGTQEGGCSVGSGYRYVFWVTGDGSRTAVFNTMGEFHVLPNKSFSVYGVDGAAAVRNQDGRLSYFAEPEETWIDLGAISPNAVRDDDMPIQRAKAIYVDGEEDRWLDSAPVDDFLLDGGDI